MPPTLTDELARLGGLRAQGQLTEEEFATAKRRLLGDAAQEPPTATAELPQPALYRSSRWSSGNLLFPDSLELSGDGVLFRKGALFSSSKEFISYKAIAFLRVKNGVFLSTLSIETSGGSQPIVINGLWKSDAQAIQDSIRAFQSRS